MTNGYFINYQSQLLKRH